MKGLIQIIYVSLILSSCQTDNFYQTSRYFETDKPEYEVGELIALTATIKPEQENKIIRFYENYKNLQISFSLMNDSLKLQNSNWTGWTGENFSETKIVEHTITNKEPFKTIFLIKIGEEGDSITFSIPEFNYRVSFESKLILDKNTIVRIHGFCNPINPEIGASLEEHFEVKDIRIKE